MACPHGGALCATKGHDAPTRRRPSRAGFPCAVRCSQTTSAGSRWMLVKFTLHEQVNEPRESLFWTLYLKKIYYILKNGHVYSHKKDHENTSSRNTKITYIHKFAFYTHCAIGHEPLQVLGPLSRVSDVRLRGDHVSTPGKTKWLTPTAHTAASFILKRPEAFPGFSRSRGRKGGCALHRRLLAATERGGMQNVRQELFFLIFFQNCIFSTQLSCLLVILKKGKEKKN